MRTSRWERSAGRAGAALGRDRSGPCHSALPYGDPEDYPEDEEEDDELDEDEDEEDEEEEEEPEWYVRPEACRGGRATRPAGA